MIRTIPEENKYYYNNTFLNFFLLLKKLVIPKKWRGAKYKTSLRDNTKNEKEEDDMILHKNAFQCIYSLNVYDFTLKRANKRI